MDQINADPKGNWHQLVQKKIINKLNMNQSVKYNWTKGRQEV
jgi:hypothetical protein